MRACCLLGKKQRRLAFERILKEKDERLRRFVIVIARKTEENLALKKRLIVIEAGAEFPEDDFKAWYTRCLLDSKDPTVESASREWWNRAIKTLQEGLVV